MAKVPPRLLPKFKLVSARVFLFTQIYHNFRVKFLNEYYLKGLKMKKIVNFILLVSGVFFLSACSGGFEVEEPYVEPLVVIETPIYVEEVVYVEPVYVAPIVIVEPAVIIDPLITLFLVDDLGLSYGGIPYICDSMNTWSQTKPNGEFSFYDGEDCSFDFYGLEGDYLENPLVDDIVRIVDDIGYGKGGIEYDCLSFGISSTYSDGSFEYDIDDECRFYL